MGGISMIKVAKLCARFNGRLVTMSVEVTVRFIALLSVFDPAQGPPRGEDDGQLTYKPRFNSAAWVVPGAMHVRKSALVATGDLNKKSWEQAGGRAYFLATGEDLVSARFGSC